MSVGLNCILQSEHANSAYEIPEGWGWLASYGQLQDSDTDIMGNCRTAVSMFGIRQQDRDAHVV